MKKSIKTYKHIALLTTLLLLLATTTYSEQYPVLRRTIEKCNKNEECTKTNKEICSMDVPNVGIILGYCIDCTGRGLNKCPNSIVYLPGANIDAVDAYQGDQLLTYAIGQVQTNNNLIGTYQVVVSVQGEPELRVYQVEWNYADSNEDEDSGTIIVTRVN